MQALKKKNQKKKKILDPASLGHTKTQVGLGVLDTAAVKPKTKQKNLRKTDATKLVLEK